MIDNKELNRSLVIPKWLSFEKVCNYRDYHIPRKKDFIINEITKKNIKKDYFEFKNNPNIISAGDLLSSAIAINHIDIAKDVARYIKSQKYINKITLNLAERILGINSQNVLKYDFNSEIRRIRQFLKRYPKNPIYWIELARLYTIKGYTEKAKRAAITAMNISPYDRYIVRAGFRFYVHIGDYDRAFYYVNKAASFIDDSWLKATEINAALLNEMDLRKIRKLNPRVLPSGEMFHYSELIESIGMLELKSGNYKKAKKNFRLAWRDPSENVVAHGEWIIRNEFPSMADDSNLDFSLSPEALTWQNYYKLKLDDAINHSRDWILQEPYSTHPFLCASHIACYAGKPTEAIKFANDGLIANPKDIPLKNNLAFAYLKLNDTTNAGSILNAYPKSLSDHDRIFYLATSGLLNYKKGKIEYGRSLYLQSIELCKKIRDDGLIAKAMLHLAIAELEAKTEMAFSFSEKALSNSKNMNYPDVLITREHISNMLKKKAASRSDSE